MTQNKSFDAPIISYAKSLRNLESDLQKYVESAATMVEAETGAEQDILASEAMGFGSHFFNSLAGHLQTIEMTQNDRNFLLFVVELLKSPEKLSASIEFISMQIDPKSFVFATFDTFWNDFTFPRSEGGGVANRLLLRHIHPETSLLDLSQDAANEIVDHARIDQSSYGLAKILIAKYLKNGVPLPPALAELCADIVEGKRPKFKTGVNQNANFIRNFFVKTVANIALHRFKITLDRNPATNQPSLAYILSIALNKQGENITEAGVRQIVKRSYKEIGASEGLVAMIEKITLATTQGETTAI